MPSTAAEKAPTSVVQINALRAVQNGHPVYLAFMGVKEFKERFYIDHLQKHARVLTGSQRKLNKKRAKEFALYISRNYSPTTIVLNIRGKAVYQNGKLIVPMDVWPLDGQHRGTGYIEAFDRGLVPADFPVPLVLISEEQVEEQLQFTTINRTQMKVNKAHSNQNLYAASKVITKTELRNRLPESISKGIDHTLRATKITNSLYDSKTSILGKMIEVAGISNEAAEATTVKQASFEDSVVVLLEDLKIGAMNDIAVIALIDAFWLGVSGAWPECVGEDGKLSPNYDLLTTAGVNVLHRVLAKLYSKLKKKQSLAPAVYSKALKASGWSSKDWADIGSPNFAMYAEASDEIWDSIQRSIKDWAAL